MRKRLRKKLRLNEFSEQGFMMGYRLDQKKTEQDRFELLEKYLEKAIEVNGLMCIGFPKGSEEDQFEAFVMVDQSRGSVTEEQRLIILDWLKNESEITSFHVGPLMDAWYSDFSGDYPAAWQNK